MALNESFPAGLRVMVVDDDVVCLYILEKMLKKCRYRVTTCSRATEAYAILQERNDAFDLVISDVYMPDLDGFKLLELIGLELDLPVIMMSANGDTNLVMKGITHGACDYLLKPVRIEELRNIWQHVVRKKGSLDFNRDSCLSDWDPNKVSVEVQSEDCGNKKRKASVELSDAALEDANSLKRSRVVWSSELHKKFVNAVNKLGIDKAVPKSILEIMKVHGLTRENVASHLQKYRQGVKKLSGIKLERVPVASFQAAENGSWGGKMQVQSVFHVPFSGANTSSSSSCFGQGINQSGAETLTALAELQTAQKRLSDSNESRHFARSGDLSLEELVVGDSSPVKSSLSGMQRVPSMELKYLMQLQQGMVPMQQNELARSYEDPSVLNFKGNIIGHENLTFQDHSISQLKDSKSSVPYQVTVQTALNQSIQPEHYSQLKDSKSSVPYQVTVQTALNQSIEPEHFSSDFDLSRLVEGFEMPALPPSASRLAEPEWTEPGTFNFSEPSSLNASFVPPSPHDLSSLLDEILPL